VAADWKAVLQTHDKQRNTASGRKHAVLTELTGEVPACYQWYLSTAVSNRHLTKTAVSNPTFTPFLLHTTNTGTLTTTIRTTGAPINRLIKSTDLTDYERLLIVRYRLNCDDAKARQLVTAVMQREIRSNNVPRGYRWGTTKYSYSDADSSVYNN
jgi:hypothetical protein